MGGFFGAVSQGDAISDVFFGTDYHSHLQKDLSFLHSSPELLQISALLPHNSSVYCH